MGVIGVGILVSRDQFNLTNAIMSEIMSTVMKELDVPMTKEESKTLGAQGRCQLLSVIEEDFKTITGAGHENIARYLAKYILGIDENSKVKISLDAKFLAWEKAYSPWGKDVYACMWFS